MIASLLLTALMLTSMMAGCSSMGGDGWDGSDTTGLEDKFEGCYFTNHYSSEDTAPAVVNFVEKFTAKYGTESLNACAALYYDAMYMLVEAAKNGGGSDTASLIAGMKGMNFTGVGGDITLDENGDAIKSIVFNTYVDGKVKWSETLDAGGNLVSSANKRRVAADNACTGGV